MPLPLFPHNRQILLAGALIFLFPAALAACILPFRDPVVCVSAIAALLATAGLILFLLHSAIYDLFPLNHPAFISFAEKEETIILLLDRRAGRICYAGPKAADYFSPSVKTGAAVGLLLDGFSPDDRESLLAELTRVRQGQMSRINEVRLVRPDSIEAWLSIRIDGIRSGGNLKRIVFVCRDVTARREAQLRLVKAREYEVEVGARIQQSLLLGQPDLSYPGLQIGAFSLPSQRIDGDFIDFFSCHNREITDFILGDVMGKGVPAALLGAAARTELMRSRLSNPYNDSLAPLDTIIARAETNLSAQLQRLNSFVTLIYGRVDRPRRLFEFIDCGHTSIIHYDAETRHCWRLKGSSMPLGFTDSQDFRRYIINLNAGDIIFTYSDGITEAVNGEGELFGEERLMHLVRSSAGLSTEELLEKIKRITFAYSAGNFRDDVTGIAIKIEQRKDELETKKETAVFPRKLEALREIRSFSREQVRHSVEGSEESGTDLCDTLELAVGEAASNILRHQQGENGRELTITVRSSLEWIAVTLEYHGNAYDWYKVPDPNVTRYQQSGYGLYLMQSSMDSVTLAEGEDDLLRLVMLKKLPGPGEDL
ncbi:SpoIIE family protein phosphatase [Marispirochaeta aestuarii]|uniref:ATP-binding SpoIIE family protein phosphatase n=1 Tax=Marispirochaeta aestuarii TaxID=1963862 RepID=UPI0029C8D230|nr:SpoIIE family protein phosphatase [Marispirochaeta aestuarii]